MKLNKGNLKKTTSTLAQRVLNRVFSHHRIAHIHGPLWRRIVFNWERIFRHLLPLGGASDGNHVHLFTDGDEVFRALENAIKSAHKRVWIETYLFAPDRIGILIQNALIEAAKRGVDVIVLYDHFGSSRLGYQFFSPLRLAGGKVFAFNPIWPWRRQGPFLFRDHRKITVIDSQIGFCGGMNIAESYAGKELGTGRFHDMLLQIKGPAVKDLEELFLETFRITTGMDRKSQYAGPLFSDGIFVQVLGSNTRRDLLSIQKAIEMTLQQATRYCYFTTPYFLPYERLRRSMIQAAKRGIDVRVLTAGLSDVPLMRLASQRVYGQFLKAGIRIYEMFNHTLHAKAASVDGVYATVGSYNLDHWSGRRNLEVNISVFDPEAAAKIEREFHQNLEFAQEVTLEHLEQRPAWRQLLQWCAYQIMRL